MVELLYLQISHFGEYSQIKNSTDFKFTN